MKPKRLLEVTGQTAQEKLRQEAKERKLARKSRTQAIAEDEIPPPTQPSASKPPGGGTKKPPRGPVVKSRGAPALTLQGLIDEFVKKEASKNEQEEETKVQPSASPNKGKRSSSKVTTLSSKTLGSTAQGSSERKQEESGSRPSSKEARTVNKEQNYGNVLPSPAASREESERIVTESIVKI